MINYSDHEIVDEENALERLGLALENCDGMEFAMVRKGYVEVLFKVSGDKLFPYLDQFMNLARNPNYDGMIDIKDNGFHRYHFFFKLPEKYQAPCFDMSPMVLTEGEGRYV